MSGHPTAEKLLRYALEEDEPSTIEAHLRDCDSCAREAARLICEAAVLGSSAPPCDESFYCIDEERVAALADAGLGAAESDEWEHVAQCELCRQRVSAVAAALLNAEVAGEVQTGKPTRPIRRRWLTGAAIAAAAVIVLGMPRLFNDVTTRAHRGVVVRPESLSVRAPAGSVDAADTFRWSSTPEADRYRLTIYDATGNVRYEMITAETTAARPDSLRFAPGRSYLWKVDAHVGWNRWSSSRLTEFTVQTARGHQLTP